MKNQTTLKSQRKIETNKEMGVFKTEQECNVIKFVEDNKGFNVNKPLKMIVSDDKKTITIRNFFLKNVGMAMVIMTDNRGNMMPIYQFDDLEPFTEYILDVPIEEYTSISKMVTFKDVSFKIIHFNAELEKLEKLKVSWRIGFRNNMNFSDVKKELIHLYMIAQTVSSDEFDIIIDHYKEIAGNLPTYNLKNEADKKHLYWCIGLFNNETWGGVTKARGNKSWHTNGYKYLNFVYCSNEYYSGGAFCAPYCWNISSQHVQLGMRVHDINIVSTAVPVTSRFCHEVGHSWGGNDDGVFNYSSMVDKNPFVIPSLAYVLQDDFVYHDLLDKKSQTRLGYTNVEKWIYNHKDLFRPEIIQRIEKDKEARNRKVDIVKSKFWLEQLQTARQQCSDFETCCLDVNGNKLDFFSKL